MSDTVLQGLVPGLFALLGAFIGAMLLRRTEYEKWLRQERTQAFAAFLRELHDTRLAATHLFYDLPGDKQERSMRVTEAFARLQKPLAIARLFASSSARVELSSLVNDIWLYCSSTEGPADHAMQIKGCMERAQTLVERELERMPRTVRWPF